MHVVHDERWACGGGVFFCVAGQKPNLIFLAGFPYTRSHIVCVCA